MQMAPQNSTLLHENAELVADKLIRYSPILTLPNENDCDSANSADEHSDVVRRRKSIHNFGTVDTQADDEVPIWICGEPRFISGVTSTTTCNEIIQALIDDELNNVGNDVAASRDLNDYVITEKWRDVEQALPGETNILPIWVAWGNARNEVKFKLKINKNKVGTKTVVDGCDVDDDVQKQTKQLKKRKIIALAQMLRRLIHQGENIKEQLASISDKPNASRPRHTKDILMQSFLCDAMSSEISQKALEPAVSRDLTLRTTQCLPKIDENIVSSPDDELFLLIDNDNCSDSGVHVEYRQYYLNRKLNLAIEAAKNGKIATYESTPKRTSSRRKLQFDALRQNSLNDRLIKYLCHTEKSMRLHRQPPTDNVDDGFGGIRREIDIRMTEMHEMIAYEEMLMQKLTEECEKYHRLNNQYMSKMHFEMCIDEVQRSLDLCAKEIIRCELELQRIKDEIHQKCGVLYNLQRMVNAEPRNEIRNASDSFVNEHIRFSDSINNKSMII